MAARAQSPSFVSFSSMGGHPRHRDVSTDSLPFSKGEDWRSLIQDLTAITKTDTPESLWAKVLNHLQQNQDIGFFQATLEKVRISPPQNADLIQKIVNEILGSIPRHIRALCTSPGLMRFSPIETDSRGTPAPDASPFPAQPQPSPPSGGHFPDPNPPELYLPPSDSKRKGQ